MMKPQDLMIGDYLTFRDSLEDKNLITVKVVAINGATNELLASIYGDPAVDLIDIDDELCGIPITPEILEKNGFKQDPRSRSRKSHQIINNDVYISWWKGRINILHKPFVGHSTNHINCDVKYVHELQHVLRMAGIEKKIIL